MKAAELREKSDADLTTELLDLRREQFNLRMQQASGALGRSDQFRQVRRNIARIKTIQRQRSMQPRGETA